VCVSVCIRERVCVYGICICECVKYTCLCVFVYVCLCPSVGGFRERGSYLGILVTPTASQSESTDTHSLACCVPRGVLFHSMREDLCVSVCACECLCVCVCVCMCVCVCVCVCLCVCVWVCPEQTV